MESSVSGEQPRTNDQRPRYAVVIERGATGYSAWVPDLPGCVAAARTEGEVMKLIREAIPFHIQGLRMDGDPVPEPTSRGEYVAVSAPA
jgi:predicted RNase H-like HicB family nuclease